MAEDRDELGALLTRIAELERERDALLERRARLPDERRDLEKRAADLEQRAGRLARTPLPRAGGRTPSGPPRIKNWVAAVTAVAFAVGGLVALGLQVRLWSAPLVWVETTCVVQDGGDDADFAVPAARPSARFAAGPPGKKARCFIPSDAVGDGLGRFDPPEARALTAWQKTRDAYLALALGLLLAAVLCALAAPHKPAED